MSNCLIALKFDTGVKHHQKVHTTHCQCLDKHPNCIRDDTFSIPQFLEMHMVKSAQLRATLTK